MRKNRITVNLKIGCFDNINSAVIFSSVSKGNAKLKESTVTAEPMLSKRPVLRFTGALLLLFNLFLNLTSPATHIQYTRCKYCFQLPFV